MGATLQGKVAVVTGAGSGIGRASALAFARERAKVVVADVSEEGGRETVRQIGQAGGEALFIEADVSQAAEVEAMVRQTLETYGRLDCAHNNAGIEGSSSAPIPEQPEENWDRVIGVNLRGVWLCMKYEIPPMLHQGGGVIINTASVLGLAGAPGLSAYVASKHGVIGLTRTAALEYARAGIRVNAVCPGAIRTPMLERHFATPEDEQRWAALEPVGRLGTPEEIAAAVVWLCSDAASFVTGAAFTIDGGLTAQ